MIWLSIILIVVIILALFYIFQPGLIIGNSMYPTYKDGEKVAAAKIFRKNRMRTGEIYIYYPPGDKRLVIKRAALIRKHKGKVDSIYFLGDNPSDSYDSRNYGFVPVKNLKAKVLWGKENERF